MANDWRYRAESPKFPGHRKYIMYHGTTLENAYRIEHEGFRVSPDGMLGPGVYVSRSMENASRYPLHGRIEELAVLKLRVRVGKVKKIDYQGHPLQKTWYENGYDTAWVPPNCGMVPSGLEEDCIYEPWRITVLDIIPIAVSPKFPGHRKYIMYHGATLENAYRIERKGFRVSPDGMLGPGVYVSRSMEKASRYPHHAGREKLAVLKLSVQVGKVKKIDYQGHPLQKTWYENGYDTAWVPPNCGMVPSGLEEDCIYEPWRITVLNIIPN